MSMPDFVARRSLSVAEYLRIEESSPTKHEYVAGEVFAMSGSVRAYLIVEQSRRRVEHHWRAAAGAWWRQELVDEQQVPIPCLDVGLTFDEIYDGVTLPAVSEPDEVEYVT